MDRETVVRDLPGVLSRLEGKGPGARANADPVDDLEVLQSFLQYAANRAVEAGELKGFPSGVLRQSAPGVSDPIAERIREGLRTGFQASPQRSGTIRRAEPEGLTVENLGAQAKRYDAARGVANVPYPDNPQNIAEWVPFIMWAIPKITTLIERIRNR